MLLAPAPVTLLPPADPAPAGAAVPLRSARGSVPGVPARRAQPGESGPAQAQPAVASATATAAAAADSRSPACAGQPAASRHTPAKMTATAHTAVSASTQRAAPSVPVPSPWTRATGQQAYAAQCTARRAQPAIRVHQQAGDEDREQQVEGDGAEAQPEPPVVRGERDHHGDRADRGERVGDRGEHVQGGERDRQQGEVAVQGDRDEPGPGRDGEPDRGHDAEHHSAGEQYERDEPGCTRSEPERAAGGRDGRGWYHGPLQEPPLVVVPPPEEDETPEDDEIPDEEDVPVEVPVDDDPPDEDEPSPCRCGSTAVMFANLAPMTVATAAESRPTRQVIFLTRRRPSSRPRAAFEYWVRVTGIRVTSDSLRTDRRASAQCTNHDRTAETWPHRLPGTGEADMVMKSRS